MRAASTTALMAQTASTSESSVNFYQTTWCINPEDSHLQVYIYFLDIPQSFTWSSYLKTLITNNIHAEVAEMMINYLHTVLVMPNSSSSLVTARKMKAKCKLEIAITLMFYILQRLF
jgi:hypothetical protein